jgi:hypothetical protein
MASHSSESIIRENRTASGVAVLGCCLLLAGCAPGTYQSAPVDAAVARKTLERVMESWKNGESIESLRKQSPAVVVQDFDWLYGIELLDYEVVDRGKEANANLIAHVKLTLKDKEGAEFEKKVTYLVGTAPALTVFRDMFH